MPNDAPRILIVQLFVLDALNLQVFNHILSNLIIVDALIDFLFRNEFKLGDPHLELARDLQDDLPDFHLLIDDDLLLLAHISSLFICLKDDRDLVVVLGIVL